MPRKAKPSTARSAKGRDRANTPARKRKARPKAEAQDVRRQRAAAVMARLEEAYPDARVALRFSSPLEMLVSTVLSAQCTDAKVNDVTQQLFRKYQTARDYAEAPEGVLERDIHATGFFNEKARSLRAIGRALVERHGGEVPRTMAELVELRGVARKTANIVLGNAYGIVEGVAVDTHVRRLALRLGLSAEEDPSRIEQDLMELWPRELWFKGSYLLIDHGRAVCTARRARCEECPVEDLCPKVGV
jgi:endonuclease-3